MSAIGRDGCHEKIQACSILVSYGTSVGTTSRLDEPTNKLNRNLHCALLIAAACWLFIVTSDLLPLKMGGLH